MTNSMKGDIMSINALNASQDHMMMMMSVLMQGMKQTADLSQKMIAVNVENSVVIGEKMAIAQEIIDAQGDIDVYA